MNYERIGESVHEVVKIDGERVGTITRGQYHKLQVTTEDGEIIGDGKDTETVTISVISGLDYVSNDRETVINYSGEVTGTIDGEERTAQITDGTVSFDVTTDKPAGSEIEVVAESLADHPAKSDSVIIEVVSA